MFYKNLITIFYFSAILMLRYQTRSCTGLAVRALRKDKKAEDQRDDENPKQTSQIRAIYAAVSAV
jgi:hypothetical protein